MNIFHKRPLALILCITVGGFVLSSMLDNWIKILLIILSLALLAITFLRKLSIDRNLVRICSVGLLISIFLSFVYFDLHFKAYNNYNDEVEICATVEKIEPISSYTSKITVKTDKINNQRKRHKFVAYLKSDDARILVTGSVISLNARITEFSEESSRQFYFSDGISASLEDISNLEILKIKKFHIPTLLESLREHLSRYTTMLCDAESGSLLTALLIGDRNKLNPEVSLNFKRIGISHVLALSGMHLAILSAGLGKLLSICKVKKKPRLALISLFIFSYMVLTGFSVSVQRAGIMLIISSALFLLSKTKDSFTSLCLAVLIICLVTPYAIYDIALWLSAFATLGIIVLSEFFSKQSTPKTLKAKVFHWILIAVLSSVFAISSTFLLSSVVFGGISLIGVFSTLIFSILVEAIMYLGCLMLAVGWLIPIGYVVSPLCAITLRLASIFSSPNVIYSKSNTPLSLVFVAVTTLLFIIFIIFKLKRKEVFVCIFVSLFALSHILPLADNLNSRHTDAMLYYSTNKSDTFLIKSKGENCLISSGQNSKNSAYFSLDILSNNGITFLDNYYLTHYSWQLEEELEIMLKNVKTQNIYLPAPQNEDEESILIKLENLIQKHSTNLITINRYDDFQIGKYRITPLYSEPYGETSMNAFSIASYSETVCYISSGLISDKANNEFLNYIKCADQVVLGCHGKKYKSKIYLSECYSNISRFIMNSENVFVTQEVMEEYKKIGCDVISHPTEVDLLN